MNITSLRLSNGTYGRVPSHPSPHGQRPRTDRELTSLDRVAPRAAGVMGSELRVQSEVFCWTPQSQTVDCGQPSTVRVHQKISYSRLESHGDIMLRSQEPYSRDRINRPGLTSGSPQEAALLPGRGHSHSTWLCAGGTDWCLPCTVLLAWQQIAQYPWLPHLCILQGGPWAQCSIYFPGSPQGIHGIITPAKLREDCCSWVGHDGLCSHYNSSGGTMGLA